MISETQQRQLEDHMRELFERGLRFAPSFAVDASALDASLEVGDKLDALTRWHQIAVEGEWDGHWQGAFSLTEKDFEQVAQHFRSLKNDTVVDYEHNSLNWFIEKSPAAGWISHMDVRETDQGLALFGRVKWTENAAKMIKAREYRYLSPTFLWRTKDRKTGADLGSSIHSVALTNTPFLDELPEVRLNSIMKACRAGATKQTGANKMDEKHQAAINAVLGLSASAGFDQTLDRIRQLQAGAAGIERIANALGLEGASVDAITTTAAGMREEIDNLRVVAGEVNKLRAESLVNQARKEGKVVASNEAWATQLAIENPAMFSEWMKHAPKALADRVNPPKQQRTGNRDDDLKAAIAAMTDEDRRAANSCGVSIESYAKANMDVLLS